MPVLQHPTCRQPEGVILIRDLGRRLVRERKDQRLSIRMSVELEAGSRFYVGVGPLAVAPQGLLAIDHGPAQAACLVIGVERREVMAMAATELGILLEEALLDIKAATPGLAVLVAVLHLGEWKLVDLAVAEQHLEKCLAAIGGALGDQLGWPYLLNLEPL